MEKLCPNLTDGNKQKKVFSYLPPLFLSCYHNTSTIYKAEVCFLFGLRQNEKFTLTSQVLGCTSKSEYIFGDKN